MTVIDVDPDLLALERVGEPLSIGTDVTVRPSFWPRNLGPLSGRVEWVHGDAVVTRIGVRLRARGELADRLLATHYPLAAEGRGGPRGLMSFAPLVGDAAAFASAHPHAFLVSLAGRSASGELSPDAEVHALRGGRSGFIRLGRDARNDVVIDDHRISRRHATFERHPASGEYVLTDCGSGNGTRVDGVRLAPSHRTRVRSHSVVDLGGLAYAFFLPADLCKVLTAAATAPRRGSST